MGCKFKTVVVLLAVVCARTFIPKYTIRYGYVSKYSVDH